MSVDPGFKRILGAGSLAMALGLGMSSMLFAQQAPQPPAAQTPAPPTGNKSALEAIEASITVSREKAEALKREIEDMQGDRAKQNAALIAAGQRVKLAEIEVADVEERLGILIASELDVRGRLDGADTNMANVLAALERIGRNPPPALFVNPTDALGSARSAILMAAIFPQLRQKAEAVTADLKKLTEIKAAAIEEEAQLKANFSILEEEQLRIATLIVARKQGVEIVSAQLEAEEQQANELAARASSLKDLVAALSTRANAVVEANSKASLQNASPTAPSLDSAGIKLALANTSRIAPAIPFAAAKGYLALPSGGTNIIDFGSGDGFGGISEGISLVTRPEAQVVAPADGWVMYKGPYLNYGQIIILNTGDDYTILLAGLDKVSVNIGQFVMMGEPVGIMGSHTIGRTVTTSAGNSRPTLYIEMRKHNEPIDPSGWWAPEITQTTDTTPNNPTQSG
jgi:septal ring factor EnvC (AmiA/AmiB activator)